MQQSLAFFTRIQENGQPLPAENLRKVFISYKRSDDVSGALKDATIQAILKCMDVAVWNDEKLTPGLGYDEEIKKAIEESDAVILLLTEHILESEYVWDKEIAAAQALEKGIIPLGLGISNEDLQEADRRLNHRHCLLCPISGNGQFNMSDNDFKDNLKRALDVYVLDVDLAARIQQFFAAGKHQVSVRYLSYEQIFYMGCGYLSGIGTSKNNTLSIPLLKSVVHGYGDDDEFVDLKKIVAGKLFYHYVESNDVAEMREYAIMALEYGNINVINELNLWYRDGSYSEMLLEQRLRSAFYRAVKKYGLREGHRVNPNPQTRTVKLTVQKVEPTEQEKAGIPVNGYEFYLTAKKNERPNNIPDYTIYLMRDDVAIDMYEPSRNPGPGNAIFLSYNPEKQTIHVLESDFDYRDVETYYCEYTYRNIFDDEIQRDTAYVGSHQYASILPYWVRRWDCSLESDISKRLFVPSKG